MTVSETEIRYYLSLGLSLCLLILSVPGGLAMGGPQDLIGAALMTLLIAMPIAIWWTRLSKFAATVQWSCIILTAAALGVLVFLS